MMPRKLARSPILALLCVLLLVACNRGLPNGSGEYPIQSQSVNFDGHDYSFYWASPDGALHHAQGDDFKLVQDERSFLEVNGGTPVIHVKADEPIAVRGRDREGGFSSWWFPFMLGYAMGGPNLFNPMPVPQTGTPSTTPAYRYPPTDTFARGDSLHGSETTTRNSPPDYRKVQPAPYAVSGQNGGTGGGAAATNKAPAPVAGQSGGVGSGSAATDKGAATTSGQSGGVGSGSAASDKSAAPAGAGSAATDKTSPGGSVSRPPAAPAPGGSSAPPASSRSGGGIRSGGGRR
jgi:hypothetical protein